MNIKTFQKSIVYALGILTLSVDVLLIGVLSDKFSDEQFSSTIFEFQIALAGDKNDRKQES